MLRRSARRDFDEFVAVCSGRLLRTSYLLSGDQDVAEARLQRALARAWSAWGRFDLQPEPFVRRELAVGHLRWWWPGRRSRLERAVAVLRYADGLSEEETADLLGCSLGTVSAVDAVVAGGRADDLRARLAEQAVEVEQTPVQNRLSGVDRAVEALHGRRRVWVAVAVAGGCAAVVAGVVVGPRLVPEGPGPQLVTPSYPSPWLPPSLAGYELPSSVAVGDATYEYLLSKETVPGRQELRMTVLGGPRPEALVWVSPPSLGGRILLSVDGDVVRREPSGVLRSGVVLSPYQRHVVVLRATRPNVSMRLGLAVYRSLQR